MNNRFLEHTRIENNRFKKKSTIHQSLIYTIKCNLKFSPLRVARAGINLGFRGGGGGGGSWTVLYFLGEVVYSLRRKLHYYGHCEKLNVESHRSISLHHCQKFLPEQHY